MRSSRSSSSRPGGGLHSPPRRPAARHAGIPAAMHAGIPHPPAPTSLRAVIIDYEI